MLVRECFVSICACLLILFILCIFVNQYGRQRQCILACLLKKQKQCLEGDCSAYNSDQTITKPTYKQFIYTFNFYVYILAIQLHNVDRSIMHICHPIA